MTASTATTRYFTSYSGVKLPLKLVGELSADDMRNRNTYYRGSFDAAERLIAQADVNDGSGEPTIIDYPA